MIVALRDWVVSGFGVMVGISLIATLFSFSGSCLRLMGVEWNARTKAGASVLLDSSLSIAIRRRSLHFSRVLNDLCHGCAHPLSVFHFAICDSLAQHQARNSLRETGSRACHFRSPDVGISKSLPRRTGPELCFSGSLALVQ
jgi:hypothetical protein